MSWRYNLVQLGAILGWEFVISTGPQPQSDPAPLRPYSENEVTCGATLHPQGDARLALGAMIQACVVIITLKRCHTPCTQIHQYGIKLCLDTSIHSVQPVYI